MKLIIGEDTFDISDEELNIRYIDEGSEGTIYQFGKQVLKLYKKNYYGKRLNEEDAKRLSTIDTKRIMMPKRLAYGENNEFIGYTTTYKEEIDKKLLGRLTMEKFLEEVNLLRMDIKNLSEQGVKIGDLHQNNFLLSDGIYLHDPGMFKICDKKDYENIYRYNIIELNYLFTVILIETYFNLTSKQIELLEKYFEPSTRLFIDKLVEEQDIDPKQKLRPYLRSLSMKFV